MVSPVKESVGTKRRVRGHNVETVFRNITNDSNLDMKQVPTKRVRGKNFDNMNGIGSNISQAKATPMASNKENNTPNIPYVVPTLTVHSQRLSTSPSSKTSDNNIKKKRSRGKGIGSILKGMDPVQLPAVAHSRFNTSNNSQSHSLSRISTPMTKTPTSCRQPSGLKENMKSVDQSGQSCISSVTTQNSTISGMSQKRQRNINFTDTDCSAKSTISSNTPSSKVTHSINHPTLDHNNVGDMTADRHLSKKCRGIISPIPLSLDKENVISTFEIGESSRKSQRESNNKDLEEDFRSESDTTEQSDDSNLEDEETDEDRNSDPNFWEGYMDIGAPDKVCPNCDSMMWNEERNNKKAKMKSPTFSLCCKNGQVKLEKEKQPPEPLATLLSGGVEFKHFKQNIRIYNCMFAMTSTGGKIQHKINKGGAPYCFKLQGQNYHLIGSLLPIDGEQPKFSQLFIYDTENEVEHRLDAVNGARKEADKEIVESLLKMLDEHNKLVKGFRMAKERMEENSVDEFKLVLISSSSASGRPNHIGPSNEVAALIVTDNDYTKSCRDTIIHSRTTGLERINETDARFMQLQYPILFPHGDEGFHLEIPLHKSGNERLKNTETTEMHDANERGPRKYLTLREYYNYKLMIRLTEGLTPHLGGRLWQQYVVDAFTAIDQYRLDWIRKHQTTIRADLYQNVRDAVRMGDNNPTHVGKAVILPASFTGCQRYMNQYFKDSLAICRKLGHPSLFLTMTTNTKWPEIQRMLKYLPGVDVADAPHVVSRVFKLKVDQLIDLVKKKHYFGRCIGVMHVIEFQKRGLPHAHMLIWLHPDDRPTSLTKIDSLSSAEIPDPKVDKVGYEAVQNYMIHGPCGSDYVHSPCMVRGNCIKHFPKRYNAHTFFDDCGFPIYKRRRTGVTVKRKGVQLDNRYVVPYNRDLLVMFQCHMNVEICNSSRSLKYLFKYCLKGHDTATMLLKKKNGNTSTVSGTQQKKAVDEIKRYLDGRYVCASEASWRIFGFDIHSRWPSVERLPIHLPGDKHVSFKNGDVLKEVCQKADSKKSKLEAWFDANSSLPGAKNCTYSDFPAMFTWHPKPGIWKERKRGDVVGRLPDVHATGGELFYLRMLLLRIKGPTSFEDLRTIEGHVYQTFKEACSALGLLQNDAQWHEAIAENSHTSLPPQLRAMFVNILAYSPVSDPLKLWETQWRCMSDDIVLRRRHLLNDSTLCLSDDEIQNFTLAEIEKLLNDIGKSLRDYPTIPFPSNAYFSEATNRLIMEATSYDREDQKIQHDRNHELLNVEQKNVYNAVIENINDNKGGLFFVYGSGGCGKTFLWQTLCCRLRSEGNIVLPVASSGIAAVLLPGGKTAHSCFHIPLKLDQYSTAGIKHGSDIAELIQRTSLIIWDEAPMQHRYAFECVDRSLRDIMSAIDKRRSKRPFGGITVVFGGDFRQILPVIPKATRAQIVGASLNASKLWDFCQVFLLKQNMRLRTGNTDEENQTIAEFSRWQLQIGDGKMDNNTTVSENGVMEIKIPDEYVVHTSGDPVRALFEVTYPNFRENMSSHSYLKTRAILTPTNIVVDDINLHILEKIQSTQHTYLSQDSMDDAGDDDNDFNAAFPVEYLNSVNMPCLPKHELKLKVGVVVMLMRNLNQIMGLCNGTRMIVTSCRKNSVECEILCGSQVGSKHLIPRIEMMPSDSIWPIDFKRTQFPLQICYAMTINKSQGQSLDNVGLYLPRSAFSHGHIYVAISRVTRPGGLRILIVDDDGTTSNKTENVVFEEVFYNLPSIDD